MSVKVAHSVLVDDLWSTAPSNLKHGAVNSRQTSTAAHRQSKGSFSYCLPPASALSPQTLPVDRVHTVDAKPKRTCSSLPAPHFNRALRALFCSDGFRLYNVVEISYSLLSATDPSVGSRESAQTL